MAEYVRIKKTRVGLSIQCDVSLPCSEITVCASSARIFKCIFSHDTAHMCACGWGDVCVIFDTMNCVSEETCHLFSS